MSDEPDPPRKFYRLKRAEIEAVNPPTLGPAPIARPEPDPGITGVHDGTIDVHELYRHATAADEKAALGRPPNREGDVHRHLRLNYDREKAVGGFDVAPGGVDPRKVRRRRFCINLALVDIPLGLFAWKVGPGNAIVFVSVIAGIGCITAWMIWDAFFLNSD